MKIVFKNNFFGYFKFFYSVIGNKLFVNFILSVFVSFLDGIGLAMFIPLLQVVGDKESSSGKSLGKLHYLTDIITKLGFTLNLSSVLVVLVLLFFIKGILKFIQSYYQVKIQHFFIRKIRFSLVDLLKGLSFEGFLKFEAGRIQNTFTTEAQRLFQAVKAYFSSFQSSVMLATYILLAFLANFQFALLITVASALSNLIYRRIYKSTKSASVSLSKKGNTFNGFLIQSVYYFKYLKSTNYFSKYSLRLKEVIKQTELLNKKIGFYNSITSSVKEPVIIFIVAIVIYLQINLMGSTLSSIILSLLLFYRALTFMVVIQNNWQTFIQNLGSIISVTSLHNEIGELQEEIVKNQTFSFQNKLHINNVTFNYGSTKILDKINITIPKNKSVAFVGESGSGKTTLVNVIAGLLKPSSGSIEVDDVAFKDSNLNAIRNKIGYVSQEPVVFNDTIFNNITFWAEATPENVERFWQTIEKVSLIDFLQSLPEKEATQLGDNGILISGGQRQRISIARELYKNAEILILDEATSALDSETEKIVQQNIERLHGSYTMIIIAHRLSTIKNVDNIYLLEKGRITASGKFNDMVEYSERFKRMVALQEV